MKKILKYAVLASLSAVAVSCNNYLDTVPDNRTEIDDVSKLSKLLINSYPDATNIRMFEARADFVSDRGPQRTYAEINTASFFWRYNVNDTGQDTPTYFWRRCYHAIAAANHAIVAGEKMNNPEAVPYIAEAKLTRAFNHFMLATSYAKFYDPLTDNSSMGIPYVNEPEDVVMKQYDRETVAKTWEKIEKDILEGIKDLGSDSKYSVPKFHFNTSAANAFAARFYLYKGEFDKAASYASKVFPTPTTFLDNGNVASTDAATLYASGNFQPWLTTYKNASSSNTIKLEYGKASNLSNLLIADCTSWWGRSEYSWRYDTNNNDTDNTVKGLNPTGGSWAFRVYSISSANAYRVPKLPEHFVYTTATTGVGHVMVPLFRNEEVLLTRAEAYVHMGRLEDAVADLNIYCRQRIDNYNETSNVLTVEKIAKFYEMLVGAETYYINQYNAYNTAGWEPERKAVLQCVLDFRRNEFKWEGLRYQDLWRYKVPITHTTWDGISNTLYPGDDRWLLQLPDGVKTAGIDVNPMTNFLSEEW